MSQATVIYKGSYPRLVDGLDPQVTSLPPGLEDVIEVGGLGAVRVSVAFKEDKERILSLSNFYKNIIGILWH